MDTTSLIWVFLVIKKNVNIAQVMSVRNLFISQIMFFTQIITMRCFQWEMRTTIYVLKIMLLMKQRRDLFVISSEHITYVDMYTEYFSLLNVF